MAADSGGSNVPYTVYDFFGYIFPGLSIIAAAYFGWAGPLTKEPGAATVTGIIAASYIVGHLNGTFANWLQPIFWKRWPGQSFWSAADDLFGPLPAAQRQELEGKLRKHFGVSTAVDANLLYDLTYTALQQAGKDDMLKMFNQQIAFLRNMATACFVVLLLIPAYWFAGHGNFEPFWVWMTTLVGAVALFAYRYRKFWRLFGSNVLRGGVALVGP